MVDTVYHLVLLAVQQPKNWMVREMTSMTGSNLTSQKKHFQETYGPWAVVTGASDGIGRAVAVELASAGLDLVLVARRRELLDELAKELAQKYGVGTRVLALDLADDQASAVIAQQTSDIDVGLLAAIAGFGTSGSFVECSVESELNMIDVNCRSVIELSHQFTPRFIARKRGGLILMSSLVAFQGVPRAATYAATKAFIQTFAEGLRLELATLGVHVVVSAPGPVLSGFGARADMRMSAAAKPETVARQTIAALGRGGTIRPGWLSKLLEAALFPLPRWGRSRIMALVMGGMTRHHGKAKGHKQQQLA
jgi:short-subunit dehydrogenase